MVWVTGSYLGKDEGNFQVEEELQAVITGVEVEGCGDELRVVKHKSKRYKADLKHGYRVFQISHITDCDCLL